MFQSNYYSLVNNVIFISRLSLVTEFMLLLVFSIYGKEITSRVQSSKYSANISDIPFEVRLCQQITRIITNLIHRWGCSLEFPNRFPSRTLQNRFLKPSFDFNCGKESDEVRQAFDYLLVINNRNGYLL